MIDGLPVNQWGPLAALCIVLATPYLLIARGLLVSRRTLEDVIHDRDEWRAESRIKDAQIAEKDGQLGHMAEVGRTVDEALRAFRTAAEARSPGGGQSVEAP